MCKLPSSTPREDYLKSYFLTIFHLKPKTNHDRGKRWDYWRDLSHTSFSPSSQNEDRGAHFLFKYNGLLCKSIHICMCMHKHAHKGPYMSLIYVLLQKCLQIWEIKPFIKPSHQQEQRYTTQVFRAEDQRKFYRFLSPQLS